MALKGVGGAGEKEMAASESVYPTQSHSGVPRPADIALHRLLR